MTSAFNSLDHLDAEVSRAYFCQLTSRSKVTTYRHERQNLLSPEPVLRGTRMFYKAADCKRHLLGAQSRSTKI